jgi:hypothetical protein
MSFKGGLLTNAGRALSTALVATLSSHAITENRQGDSKNNEGRRLHRRIINVEASRSWLAQTSNQSSG